MYLYFVTLISKFQWIIHFNFLINLPRSIFSLDNCSNLIESFFKPFFHNFLFSILLNLYFLQLFYIHFIFLFLIIHSILVVTIIFVCPRVHVVMDVMIVPIIVMKIIAVSVWEEVDWRVCRLQQIKESLRKRAWI